MGGCSRKAAGNTECGEGLDWRACQRGIGQEDGSRGRSANFHQYHEDVGQRRAGQETEDLQERMRRRPSIEGTIVELTRKHGAHRACYRGQNKVRRQALLMGATVNLKRLAHALAAKERPAAKGLAACSSIQARGLCPFKAKSVSLNIHIGLEACQCLAAGIVGISFQQSLSSLRGRGGGSVWRRPAALCRKRPTRISRHYTVLAGSSDGSICTKAQPECVLSRLLLTSDH